jgi:iron complex transport system substrate-binding protein
MLGKNILKKVAAGFMIAAMSVSVLACGNSSATSQKETVEDAAKYSGVLEFDHNVEFTYVKNASVEVYKGGYKMIKINNNNPILVVPEGMAVPTTIDSDVCVLQQPVSNLLISSTPTMSLLNSIDALDSVALTTTDTDSWYIDNVKQKMQKGDIKYVGSPDAPDYELITASGCNFAVFSNAVTDDVAATLKQLGVNYIVDQSSLEDHPLARVEWAKIYGAMLNKEDSADKAFAEQEQLVTGIQNSAASIDKTVAVFYITSSGGLYARNSDDYMTKMVTIAGGKYILDGKIGVGKTGTTKMEPEAFYAEAGDADIIIYIWSMGGKPSTLSDFTARSTVLADMKAVKNGNVWCTTPDFFQTSSTIGNIISDINKVLTADENSTTDTYTYLYKLK